MNARISAFERLILIGTYSAGTVNADPKTCWTWPNSKCHKGYGRLWFCGKPERAHIVAWEFAKGRKVRRGYTLDHRVTCARDCWRPSHLEEVTRAENTARGNRAKPRSTEKARAAKMARLRVEFGL